MIYFWAETYEKLNTWRPNQDIIYPLTGFITVTSACHQGAEGFSLDHGFIRADNDEGDKKFTDPLGRFSNLIEVRKPYYDT